MTREEIESSISSEERGLREDEQKLGGETNGVVRRFIREGMTIRRSRIAGLMAQLANASNGALATTVAARSMPAQQGG